MVLRGCLSLFFVLTWMKSSGQLKKSACLESQQNRSEAAGPDEQRAINTGNFPVTSPHFFQSFCFESQYSFPLQLFLYHSVWCEKRIKIRIFTNSAALWCVLASFSSYFWFCNTCPVCSSLSVSSSSSCFHQTSFNKPTSGLNNNDSPLAQGK